MARLESEAAGGWASLGLTRCHCTGAAALVRSTSAIAEVRPPLKMPVLFFVERGEEGGGVNLLLQGDCDSRLLKGK